MSVASEIQSLSPSALIELFVIDLTSLGGGIERFHCGTNNLSGAVVWQGVSYVALPIEATGFDVSTRGTLPRPKLKLANIGGLFSYEIATFDDLINAKVTRKRTFVKYLDVVNFSDGVNPTADPNQSYPDDIWFVDQKVSENKYTIEWELASPFDLQGVMMPRRQVVQNTCPWKYRGPECGYTGTLYFDSGDVATSNSANDFCGKRLSSCKKRFSGSANGIPFGGFPGVVQY